MLNDKALAQAAPPPATDANGAYLTWAELDALAQAAPPPEHRNAFDGSIIPPDEMRGMGAAPPSGLDVAGLNEAATALDKRHGYKNWTMRQLAVEYAALSPTPDPVEGEPKPFPHDPNTEGTPW